MVSEASVRKQIRSFSAGAVLCLLLTPACLTAQEQNYEYFYRIYFTDKGENEYHSYTLSELVSERSVERRRKSGTYLTDITDIPVYQEYITEITGLGYRLHCTSRWMNTALFKSVTPGDIASLLELGFVREVALVKKPGIKSSFSDKLDLSFFQGGVPSWDNPVAMLNGTALHNSRFDGKGILIALLDGGFFNADIISSLNHLRSRGGIAGTYDFVTGNEFVYGYHTHGTAVLSVIAGDEQLVVAGSAPGADYLLFRTEEGESEFPAEEDYWIAGAERADSLGADIISSSLGYSVFDDPSMNYKYSSMDGNTAFVTRAAAVAASKGILVVNSAGNERNKEWKYIIAPSDGRDVLAVGAVDQYKVISSFSSAGPAYDRRIKPDVSAQGVAVPLQRYPQMTEAGSGTSFSCPVISGLCACLLQAVPSASGAEILYAVRRSADRYLTPDSLYGYGIPDMKTALALLQEDLITRPEDETMASPNPFTGNIEITFRNIPERLTVEIFTTSGTLVARETYRDYVSRKLTIENLQNAGQGIYYIRLRTAGGTFTHKMIKTRQ